MEPDWTASYYEALEFFHREPQHIGRKKCASARFDTPDKVRRHLHRMETTLNHNLRQFFLLTPSTLRNELFAGLFTRRFGRPFVLWGDDIDSEFAGENATQPDLLFVSDVEVVAVEMKITTKCSLTQVLTYALLGLAVELRVGGPRRHCLTVLGRGDFASQWDEHFGSATELKLAIAHEDLDAFLSTQPDRFLRHEGRFREIVASLDLAFISYAELAAFLREAAPPASDETPGAQVYRKLIAGMLAELHGRGLAF